MELFGYFNSSAAYRVRIALNIKRIDYRLTTVNLRNGEAGNSDYQAINPQKLVPALRLDDGRIITQSTAIIEYLEERHPYPELLSDDAFMRATQRSLASVIACDIHPLNNLRVLQYIEAQLNNDTGKKDAWYAHWITEGFRAIESHLQTNRQLTPYACGDKPSLVDVYLVPQVFNAQRFGVPMDDFFHINRIYQECNNLDAFIRAEPKNQPDYL